jgi:hypothetical protein
MSAHCPTPAGLHTASIGLPVKGSCPPLAVPRDGLIRRR